ncbi:MAG TPA: hypothetical protein VGQ76_27825 [Thermoanaerobaculia bacterium]|jgi:hypothetical protein|nr:hypothetical protein [Thermoanaerobaculia bacterium]
MHLVALLLAAALTELPDTGRIKILNLQQGATVLVDGQIAGTPAVGETTLLVSSVRPGRRTIVIRTPGDGDSRPFYVDVYELKTATLTLSQLTTVRRNQLGMGAGDIRVSTIAPPCTVTIADSQYHLTTPKPVMARNLSAGKSALAVSCGAKRLTGEVTVRDGFVTIVALDPVRGKISVTGEEPRARKVEVRTARDSINAADIPGDWKRAISAAMGSGVLNASIDRIGLQSIYVTFECSSANAASRVIENLKNHSAVEEVEVTAVEKLLQTVQIRVEIIFLRR